MIGPNSEVASIYFDELPEVTAAKASDPEYQHLLALKAQVETAGGALETGDQYLTTEMVDNLLAVHGIGVSVAVQRISPRESPESSNASPPDPNTFLPTSTSGDRLFSLTHQPQAK